MSPRVCPLHQSVLQGGALGAQERPPGADGPAGSDGHRDPGSGGRGRGGVSASRERLAFRKAWKCARRAVTAAEPRTGNSC